MPQPESNLFAGIRLEAVCPAKVHVDLASCRAANWVDIRGWIAGVQRGRAEISANLSDVCFALSERPDVCIALGEAPSHAYGFTIQLLAREPFANGEVAAELFVNGKLVSRLRASLPANDLPFLPFASTEAIRLTRELYRHSTTGERVEGCDDVLSLAGGVIAPVGADLSFDNTRIGNYHPETAHLLAQPGVVGLDIGCGIRDVVFDNLVTQDIYPTPSATLVTRPEEKHLPFSSGVFDVVILDSVLEHVPNPVAFLGEAKRVLKRGGLIVGDVPFLQPLHLAPHHYFNFTPYGLESVATQAGLALKYARAEPHQRPEFSLEWLLRRTLENISVAEAERLRAMPLGDFYAELVRNKNLIGYPVAALEELSSGYRFRMIKE